MPEDESYLNKRGLTHFWENIDALKQDKLTAGANITIASDNTISASQPTVNNATLTIQKEGTSVGTFTANASTNSTVNIIETDPTVPAWAKASSKPSYSWTEITNKPTIPTKTSDLTNDSGFLTDTDYATASTGGVIKVGAGLAISSGGVLSATGGGTADAVAWGHITGTMSNQTDLTTALGAKANSADLATVATSGDYDDLTDKPTIGNATLTIQKNGTSAGTFTANATSNKTINITVPTTAADVSALPASTKYGASIAVSINTTDYKVTTTLKDQDGNTLGTAQVIDLPLESVVVNGSYDNTNKKIVLTLQNGNTIDIPVADLVAGLQSEITSTNKLASDLVDDTGQTNKFMTSAEKTKLSGIAAGAEVNVQSDWNQTTTTADDYIKNKPNLATVATSGAYSDLSGTPSLATVATSGSYNDLSNKPTIPAAQVNSDWNSTSGVSEILNKPTLSTVATTGDYGDLTGTPNLATVATSGSYNDLSNKPTIPTVNNATLTIQKNGTNVQTFTANQSTNATANITVPTKTSDLTNDSNFVESGDLATVATSGSYNDLSNKPTIPAAQVQSNWTQTTTTAVDYIKNKPTLATVATSGAYDDLSNKPTIPTVNNATLTIQKNGTNVQTFTANQSTNATANIETDELQRKSDTRSSMKPSDANYPAKATLHFSTVGAFDNQTNTGGFVDALVLNSWGNDSGGRVNALVATKQNDQKLYHYTGTFNGESWSGKKEIAYTDDLASATVSKADQLTTARTIALSGGAIGTATSFNGTSNISIPVTKMYETYLDWGNQNLSGRVSCVDAALSEEFSANRLAYMPASTITVEYSRDSGSTWTTYSLTDAQKVALVTTTQAVFTGGTSSLASSTCQLRVTIAPNTQPYMNTRKLFLNISTNGVSGAQVLVEKSEMGATAFSTVTTATLAGWSGWNSIPMNITFGGTASWSNRAIRLTFSYTGKSDSYPNAQLNLNKIRLYGETTWSTPSNLANNGHMYTYDTSQNVTFPANVKVTGSLQHGNYTYTLPNKNGTVAMTSDIPSVPTVNNGQLTIQKNGSNVATFTANQSGNATANITVPTKTSDLTNDSGFLDSVAWGDITGKPTFATVATSGSYNDLSNKPTIPTVNNATLTIQKNGTTVKTFTANASSNVTANITVPTKTSDLTNDSGFITSSTLPVATDNSLGMVQVGSGLAVSNGGVLTADNLFLITVTSYTGSDGYYDITIDKTFPEIMAAHQAGKTLILTADIARTPDSGRGVNDSYVIYAMLDVVESYDEIATTFNFVYSDVGGNNTAMSVTRHTFAVSRTEFPGDPEIYDSFSYYVENGNATNLTDGGVTTSKIANDAVTAAKIAGGDALSTLAGGALVEVVGTTTGDYNYAWKYADGRLICFQQYSWSGKSTSAYGQLHSARVMTPKNYAVQFTSLPAVEVNLIASPNQWNGWLCTAFEGGAGTVARPTEYQFIRPTGGTNTNGTLCLVAYGFWK